MRAAHARAPHRRSDPAGQTMVELALVLPLFVMVFFGIIVLGLGLFFQQQVTNAAREAARYAAIHSATAQRPVVGHLDPNSQDPPGVVGTYAPPDTYLRYYTPANGWEVDGEGMTPEARRRLFGLNPDDVKIAACWSGYRNTGNSAFDAPPPGEYEIASSTVTIVSSWAQCSIDGSDPTTSPGAIGCSDGLPTDDEASSMSEGPGVIVGNTVTAYACYEWSPPLAGFLLIPDTVTLRAVVTEPLQRQQ
jgi:hypothetical protein